MSPVPQRNLEPAHPAVLLLFHKLQNRHLHQAFQGLPPELFQLDLNQEGLVPRWFLYPQSWDSVRRRTEFNRLLSVRLPNEWESMKPKLKLQEAAQSLYLLKEDMDEDRDLYILD